MRRFATPALVTAIAGAILVSSCATYTGQTSDPNDPNHTRTGALIGGIGAYQDRQEAALRRDLQGTGVDVVRQGDNITLNMPGNITFAFDSSNLQPQFYPVLDSVANTLTQYNQTVIEVAGHTDNVGSDAYNQQLSVQRANAVAGYLGSKGVLQQRMMIVGAGETRPIASNDTDAGRAQNRRVEITIVPVRS